MPFAFWLVSAFRPKCLVELGTHRGMSYLAFCQAINDLGTGTKSFAIDHWKGDAHAGFYKNRVFEELTQINNQCYGQFSTLLRMDFDAAASHFAPGSVDLLHIDGLHTYEAVRHDFETWSSKLADPAIVLFHDTCVFDRNFGVHAYWSEVSTRFPSFGFHHGYGLGVLGIGRDFANFPEVQALFNAASDERDTEFVRLIFAQLGGRLETAEKLKRYTSSPVIGFVKKLLDLRMTDESSAGE